MATKKRGKVGRPKGNRGASADEWQPAFLESLRTNPNIKEACNVAGIVRAAAYLSRAKSKAFAEQWDAALKAGIDHQVDVLESAMWRRAETKSDLLLIFALKALKPDVYGDRTRIDMTHHVKIDDVATAFRSFVTAVKRHVSDPATIGAIEADFTAAIKSSKLDQLGAGGQGV